jgi:glycosyltransferase involved in cell wall biosynthesis
MKLSVCLITKNEEQVLADCLKSIQPVADEIIVVDTGSTDRTKAVAAAGQAKVFDYPWQDDFAAARNFSLEQAAGPWILVIDADEMVDPLDYEEIRNVVASDGRHGYEMTLRSYFTSPNATVLDRAAVANRSPYQTGKEYPYYVDYPGLRLFRKDPRIKFSGRIHESVGPSLTKHGLRLGKSSLVVHHFGKLLLDREEKKKTLYLELAFKNLQENPNDLKCRYDYGMQLFTAGQFQASAEFFAEMIDKKMVRTEPVYLYLARSLNHVGRHEEATTYVQRALAINPNNVLSCCVLGDALHGMGQEEDAAAAYQRAAALNPHFPEPYFGLSNVLWDRGRVDDSFLLLQKCVALDPDNRVLLETLAARLINKNRPAEALPYCHRLIEKHPGHEAEHWYVYLGLYYSQTGNRPKGMEILQKGLLYYPNSSKIQALLGRMKMKAEG